MPIATPEVHNRMLDAAKAGEYAPPPARTVAHRRLAAAPLRIARQIVEHLEPRKLFIGMRVE